MPKWDLCPTTRSLLPLPLPAIQENILLQDKVVLFRLAFDVGTGGISARITIRSLGWRQDFISYVR